MFLLLIRLSDQDSVYNTNGIFFIFLAIEVTILCIDPGIEQTTASGFVLISNLYKFQNQKRLNSPYKYFTFHFEFTFVVEGYWYSDVLFLFTKTKGYRLYSDKK